jgi:hypothetical protein
VRLKLYRLWHNGSLYRRTWYDTRGLPEALPTAAAAKSFLFKAVLALE